MVTWIMRVYVGLIATYVGHIIGRRWYQLRTITTNERLATVYVSRPTFVRLFSDVGHSKHAKAVEP